MKFSASRRQRWLSRAIIAIQKENQLWTYGEWSEKWLIARKNSAIISRCYSMFCCRLCRFVHAYSKQFAILCVTNHTNRKSGYHFYGWMYCWSIYIYHLSFTLSPNSALCFISFLQQQKPKIKCKSGIFHFAKEFLRY